MTTIASEGRTLAELLDARTGSFEAPAWVGARRDAAAASFAAAGIPSRRDEEWRFTNLGILEKTAFRVVDGLPAVSADDVARFDIPGLEGPRLVFVNGVFAPAFSTSVELPSGVRVLRFEEAMRELPELMQSHLGAYASDAEPLTAFNTAHLDDGVLVHVAKNVQCDIPIRVLNLTTCPGGPVAVHPRHLVVAESGAEVTLIEDFAGLVDDEMYFTNAVTEIFVAPNAHVHHYVIERESRAAVNVSTLKVQQERDSNLSSHSVLFGGAIVRNNVNPVLAGENCDSLLNGLYVADGDQHLDNHMRVQHASPHCESRQHYKGVLNDRGRGVFSGRIVVDPDAQKTDAVQQNANLLLSADARADTKPQLEIYADDVKCTHGATIGEMDEDALFYLRSRGMNETRARALMVHAFAGESLERMDLEPVRAMLTEMLLDRLPDGRRLDPAVV